VSPSSLGPLRQRVSDHPIKLHSQIVIFDAKGELLSSLLSSPLLFSLSSLFSFSFCSLSFLLSVFSLFSPVIVFFSDLGSASKEAKSRRALARAREKK